MSITLRNASLLTAMLIGVVASTYAFNPGATMQPVRQTPKAPAVQSIAAPKLDRTGTTKVLIEKTSQPLFLASPASTGATLTSDLASFVVYQLPTAQALAAANLPGATIRADFDAIALRRASLDTHSGSRAPSGTTAAALRAAQHTEPQRHLGLVQFPGPVTKARLNALTAAGAAIVHYLPQNAYLIWTDSAEQRAALSAQVGEGKLLQFFDDFLPGDALSPAFETKQPPAGDVDATVQFFNAPAQPGTQALSVAQTQQVLALASAVIVAPHPVLNGLYTNLTVRVPAASLAQISAIDTVVNVEPWIAPTMNSERQAQEMAGNLNPAQTAASGAGYLAWLTARGFPTAPSSYPVLTVSDSGIDDGSTSPIDPSLHEGGTVGGASRLISNFNATTDASASGVHGHGHINASISMGYDIGLGVLDASTFLRGLGINPYGRIAGMKVFTSGGSYSVGGAGGTDPGVIAAEWNQNADISTNSWGAPVGGSYNAASQAYDFGVRDATSAIGGNQQLSFIFSAGNSGSGSGTIGSPGTAKNVITVGASEGTDADGTDGCGVDNFGADNIQQIIGFSSRGPCTDGRMKPDIVAPGTHVTGTASTAAGYSGAGVCDKYWPIGQTVYARSSGTSHSTPATAGFASLAWNFLGRQYAISRPSPAMLKAYILHSARYLFASGGNLPDTAQGYGFTDMGLGFSTAAPRVLRDQSIVLSNTGESYTIGGSVADPGQPVRIALVWTDAAGSTVGSAWVNDLNLSVTVNGVTYKGNVFSGGNSVTGGTADTRNNVECVFLPAGQSGPMIVTVSAANLAGDGVPGNADTTDQDFALVVYNMVDSGVGLSGTGVNTYVDSVGNGTDNGNGRIDSGETSIDLTVQIQNLGGVTATGVVGTLTSLTPTVTVTAQQTTGIYPSLAQGATATNATPYRLSVSASHPCGNPIDLRLDISSAQGAGVYTFSLPTGQAGTIGAQQVFSYTGPPVFIPDNNATGIVVPLDVSAQGSVIADVQFSFDGTSCSTANGSTTVGLDHTYVSDLVISLQSPTGTTISLSNHTAGAGHNFCQTLYTDTATLPFSGATSLNAPFTGSWRPIDPLSSFIGQNPNGTWKLFVKDQASIDTGNVRYFSIYIRTIGQPTCDPPAGATTCKPNLLSATGCLGPTDLLLYLHLYFLNYDGLGSSVPASAPLDPPYATGPIFGVPCSPVAGPPVIPAEGLKADYNGDCQIDPTDLLGFLGDYFNPVAGCFSGC